MRNKLTIILPCLLLLVSGLAACSTTAPLPTPAPTAQPALTPKVPTPQPDDWARVKAAGVLRVASSLDNPPFDMYTASFKPDGFDVALMTEVAHRLGLEVGFSDFAFEGLLGALQLEQTDAVIAAMAITDDRLAVADFTRAYYQGEDAILAAPNSPINTVAALADVAGRRVGVQRGTVYETWLKKSLVQTNQMAAANLQIYSKPEDAVRDLSTGRIDLVVLDRVPALAYAAQGQAKVVGKSLSVQDYAIAVRKGSTLLPQLNQALAQVAMDGTVARLAERYLQVPAGQVTPVPAPTSQPAPPPTALPSPQATPTPAPAPVDGMAYVADLTLDDHNMTAPAVVQPGQALHKGWRVRNAGTTTWSPDYRLSYATGNTPVSDMGGRAALIGVPVPPGGTADVYVDLVAPQAPGTYQGFWQMVNASGVPFGQKVYVAVVVPAPPTPIPPPTPTPAPGISFSTDRNHIAAGECATVSWNVTNVRAVYFCPVGGACQGVAGQASQQVCPAATTSYELRVEGTDGQVEVQQLTINVAPQPNVPSITVFSADRYEIYSGQCLNLWWKVEGDASRIALLRGGAPLWDRAAAEHSYTDCPPGSGQVTYEVQAWGPGGSGPVKRQLTITIKGAPPPPPPPPPSPTAAVRRNINGSWASGNYHLQLSEALGCGGPVCHVTGNYAKSTGGTPQTGQVNGTVNVNTGEVSLNIVVAMPGAPAKTFVGSLSGDRLTGNLSGEGQQTFSRQ